MAKRGPKPGFTVPPKPHDIIHSGGAVGVLLSNHPERVWVDQADYQRIVERFGTKPWSWVKAKRYVRLKPSREESFPVARLVLENEGTGYVHFVDGDRLNLRRSNRSVQTGLDRGVMVKRAPRASPAVRAKPQKPIIPQRMEKP